MARSSREEAEIDRLARLLGEHAARATVLGKAMSMCSCDLCKMALLKLEQLRVIRGEARG